VDKFRTLTDKERMVIAVAELNIQLSKQIGENANPLSYKILEKYGIDPNKL
jgi:hypothetical protein